MKKETKQVLNQIKDNIRELSKMAGQPALLFIENVEYLDDLLKAQKADLIEDLKKIVEKEDCRAGEACGSERLKQYIQDLKKKKH